MLDLVAVHWIDYLSDWRWVSPANELFKVSLEWVKNNLPEKFSDAIMLYEAEMLDHVHRYLQSRFLDEPCTTYKAEPLESISYDEVSVSCLHAS